MAHEAVYLRIPPSLKDWLDAEKARTKKSINAIIIEHLQAVKASKKGRPSKKALDSDS